MYILQWFGTRCVGVCVYIAVVWDYMCRYMCIYCSGLGLGV